MGNLLGPNRPPSKSMNMSNPVIIAAAITGSVPRKADNPAVPITVAEQIASTHEAFEAGAYPCAQR